MAQKQKANHQLNCSYPFPRVQKQVPFAQGPRNRKQSFGLFIPFLKGPKTVHTLSRGPRNRKQTIIWTVHTLSQGSKGCPYPFPRVAPAAGAASATIAKVMHGIASCFFHCFLLCSILRGFKYSKKYILLGRI